MIDSKVVNTFKNFFAEVGSRLPDTLAVTGAYCLPVFAFVWYSGLVDDVYARIWISTLVTIIPVATLLSKPKHGLRIWRWQGEELGSALFLWLAMSLAIVTKFGIVGLGIQLSVIIGILPWCWFIWLLLHRNWWLLTGLVLSFALFMLYWVAALAKFGDPWEFLLLPLIMVAFGGLAWAPVASLVLNMAQRRKHRRVSGPATQAAAMITLFLPVILVAVAVPRTLQLGDTWSAVSLTVVGVLLSAVVSEPLRRFLVESGGLRSCHPEGDCPYTT